MIARCTRLLTLIGPIAITLAVTVPSAPANAGIAAVVNDELITKYAINQRINLMLMSAPGVRKRLQARLRSKSINQEFRAYAMKRNPQSRAEVRALQKKFVASIRSSIVRSARKGMRKRALEQLIDEQLKIQEAKRNNIVVSQGELDKMVETLAKRNKRTPKQFAQLLGRANVQISTFKKRLQANVAWQRLIRRKFGRQITVANQDVERLVGDAVDADDASAAVELRLQRVKVTVPGKLNQTRMAQNIASGESARSRFRTCTDTNKIAASLQNAAVENLGWKNASSFQEPTRSILLNEVGRMTPPLLTSYGFQMYAVCAKRAGKKSNKKRTKAREDLRQTEFQLLAKRHLRDLRRDAFIEYR